MASLSLYLWPSLVGDGLLRLIPPNVDARAYIENTARQQDGEGVVALPAARIMSTSIARSPGMTRLLVSVRSPSESAVALRAGADLIDVKEPSRGPLGVADFHVVGHVLRQVAGQVPVSAALGELCDWRPGRGGELPAGLAFAKLGLSGCAARPDWPRVWARAVAVFPPEVGAVGVIYADRTRAASPSPDHILAEAVRMGCRALLVDTFDKTAGGLLECWPARELADFVDSVKQAGMLVVLAGSLSAASVAAVLSMEPDYVAVRGAACRGGRTGVLDGARVAELARIVRRRNFYRFSSIA